MRRILLAALSVVAGANAAHAAEWQLQRIDTPARVTAIETVGTQVRVNAGGLWYAITLSGGRATLAFVETPAKQKHPEGALADGRIVAGSRDIARAWFAEPTNRYDHGILGDKIEAGSLVIEARDGKVSTVRLKDDAVFEDLEPRLADLDGDGHDEIVVVKSYLKRGSSLAMIAERRGNTKSSPRRRRSARRTAGSIRPASPISTATAKSTSRWCASRMSSASSNYGAGKTALCAKPRRIPTFPITSPARAQSTWPPPPI